jgi:hypothetical protein
MKESVQQVGTGVDAPQGFARRHTGCGGRLLRETEELGLPRQGFGHGVDTEQDVAQPVGLPLHLVRNLLVRPVAPHGADVADERADQDARALVWRGEAVPHETTDDVRGVPKATIG